MKQMIPSASPATLLAATLLPLFFLILLLILLGAAPAAAQEREFVPAPPGGGPGTTTLAGDGGHPGASGGIRPRPDDLLAPLPLAGFDKNGGTLGGDDQIFRAATGVGGQFPSTAYDSQGAAYYAQSVVGDPAGEVIVLRSTDGGHTWATWGTLYDPDPTLSYRYADICIAEGAEDRCYVATVKQNSFGEDEIIVAWAALGTTTATFTEVVAMSVAGEDVFRPRLATDAASFESYYLYLVAQATDGTHGRIRFCRSQDRGATWESSYVIGEVTGSSYDYIEPRVAYGYGGRVHVCWFYQSDSYYGTALRYRGADSYAGGGLAAWGTTRALGSTADAQLHRKPELAASLAAGGVVIASDYSVEAGSAGVRVWASADGGATWDVDVPDVTWGDVRGLAWQPSRDRWLMNLYGYGTRIYEAAAGAPETWTLVGTFGDGADGIVSGNCFPLALNPAREDRIGAFWSYGYEDGTTRYFHDAEWFTDEGWPDEEVTSPTPLAVEPSTAPALADLDGDGDQEIVFTDADNRVVALHHDGTAVAGWPQVPGPALVTSPVAVGDLNGDGRPEVAVGTTLGRVFLYEGDGSLVPGWPVTTTYKAPAHVSIGALGPPYHRVVVACAGSVANIFNWRGALPDGFALPVTVEELTRPAAIGDVDGDGLNDLVISGAAWVAAYHPTVMPAAFARTLPQPISDTPTLADLDLDGVNEVLVPTTGGRMYAMTGAGADLPGWPFDTGTGFPLSSAAAANARAGGEPEVVFAGQDFTVYALWADGTVLSGYPTATGDGWWIYADPVVVPLTGSSDVVIGARDQAVWAWDNFGDLNAGWPRELDEVVHLTAAAGDVDDDGSLEVVVLGRENLHVYDLNGPLDWPATWAWPMQGFDARRTSCWMCVEDLVSAVGDDDPATPTRVGFAVETRNPAVAQTVLSCTLPERAQVDVKVYDVRGRVVRTLLRSELAAGTHRVVWDGRDGDGRLAASGQYLVRMRARGPRLDEQLVRKVTRVH